MPVLLGRASKKVCSALSPPADAPIPTTVGPFFSKDLTSLFSFCFLGCLRAGLSGCGDCLLFFDTMLVTVTSFSLLISKTRLDCFFIIHPRGAPCIVV